MELSNSIIPITLVGLFTYLLAAIPFGLIFGKIAGLGDIRNIGSGNIGATNVLRTGNKKVAALTLIFDGLKGMAAVLISRHFIPDSEYAFGLLAILAHIFPIYLKFKGGKGVATALGVYSAWSPILGLAVLFTWILSAKLFKISSLAAIIAAILAPLFVYLLDIGSVAIVFSALISVILIYTHRDNICRLINKQEPLIS